MVQRLDREEMTETRHGVWPIVQHFENTAGAAMLGMDQA